MRVLSCSFYCLFGVSLVQTSAFSSELWVLNHTSSDEVKANFSFKTTLRSLDESSGHVLVLKEKHRDRFGKEHARYSQYYQGVEVWGSQLIVHRTLGQKEYLTGQLIKHLEDDLNHSTPKPVLNQRSLLNNKEDQLESLIYVDDSHVAHWAYRVTSKMFETKKGEVIRRVKIIDAETLKVVLKWNDIKTIAMVNGSGYGGNEKTGKTIYDEHTRPPLKFMRNSISGRCSLQNNQVSIYDMRPEHLSGRQVASFACPQEEASGWYWTGVHADGYDAVNQAYSVWNDALYIGTVIHDLYSKEYGVPPLDRKKTNVPLKFRVHYGQEYENAFWDGAQMTFGDGGSEMYPLLSLGVAAHEVSHGFTEYYSDLVYIGQSGGLNESFSDMAAKAAEDYARSQHQTTYQKNWTIGEDIMKDTSSKKALRYMDHPEKDGYSIDSARKYVPRMDVHYSSGVYNRFFYLLSTSPRWSIHRAFEVMLKANMDYWTPTVNFNQAACGVIDAARDLHYPPNAIDASFSAVGISTENCFKKMT